MKLNIRQAKLEDAHLIAEAERAIAQTPGFFCSIPSELTDESVINSIQAALNDQTGFYLLADYNEQLVGHAFLEPFHLQSLRHVADLNIAVHLGWQHQGIGTKLIEKIIESAKNSGVIEKIQLNVRATNTPAITLYKKMGFQEEGLLKKRIKVQDHYIDDLIMGLELKEAK